ncbi:ABC transporter substrate-binding protein [Bacillus testis]|uniref:ABC transporter substrate-binding protein n=1 Tax=Bacillus testis TaxID=1622072 RepID=UPI00067F6B4F|nr:ABC transporter substrate-binding protein [Bacillus testis]
MGKARWTMAAGVLSILLLAGCSSKTNDDVKGGNDSKDQTYTIGFTQFVEHPSLDEASKGFKKAIKDKGLKVKYDDQNAQGDQNNTATIANNFVSQKVDLIFANATPSALAALNATKDIPIIFTSVTDPVSTKLVKSMEKPGGNITGTSDTHPEAIPSTVAFIADEMKAKRVGTIYNSGEQNSLVQIKEMKKAAKEKGVKVVESSVSTSSEVKQAAESLAGKVDAIYIITDNTVVQALESVIMVAKDKKLPLFAGELDSVKRGAFAAYGFSYYDIGYQAGEMAASILKDGKKAEDIPAEYPKKLHFSINEKAAEEMGVTVKDEWKEKAELVK